MTAELATQPKQYAEQTKAWAVSLYNGGATCYEVEKKTGIRASYIRTLAKRFSEKKEVAPAETVSPVSEIVASETNVEKQVETAVKQAKTPWRIVAFVVLAFAIVVGHAGLVWYDMSLLWSTPGKIGGGVVFAFILSGMVLMAEKSEQMADVRENMLWAVGALEALAVVVHRGAFSRNAGEAYNAGFGVEYIWALSAVICLCSIGATIFYQKVIR